MKIVNKQEFYKLPAGTVFSEYEPQVFTGLHIKADNICNEANNPIDYVEMDLIGCIDADSSEAFAEILDKAEQMGERFALDFAFYGRNGMYDDEQLYAVYEKDDLVGLISTLTECLKQAY